MNVVVGDLNKFWEFNCVMLAHKVFIHSFWNHLSLKFYPLAHVNKYRVSHLLPNPAFL